MKIKMELDNRETPLEFTEVEEYELHNKFFIVVKEETTFFIKVDTIINAQIEYEN